MSGRCSICSAPADHVYRLNLGHVVGVEYRCDDHRPTDA